MSKQEDGHQVNLTKLVDAQTVTPYMQAHYGTGDCQPETEPTRTITKDRDGHVEATVTAPPFTLG
ncbi:hypothetical protein LJR257_004702 [Ensifer adhaerens]|nr:hypothetical protein [Ensifer sp. ENS11]MDP9633828.1 hypothetical protein [Ensifer adhaerens]